MDETIKPTRSGKVRVNEKVEIYFETFGHPSNPPILLIMGLDAQCILYGEKFIKYFLEKNIYVIRFDNRDIGYSTWMNDSWSRRNPYTLSDMAQDSLALLDFLHIEKVHLFGISMGGMIAQQLAIDYGNRVLSMITVMSSGFLLDSRLVKSYLKKIVFWIAPVLLKYIYVKNKYSNHKITVGSYVATYRKLCGKRYKFDEPYFRMIFTESIEKRKGQNPRARYQQFCAIVASGSRLKQLSKINTPVLVIHGTADPLIPHTHADEYARVIPQSKLIKINGVGHELPNKVLEKLLPEMMDFIQTNHRY